MLPWVAFNAAVLAVLAIDLGLFNRRAHDVSVREAATWSAIWIALALAFAGWVFHAHGRHAGMEFIAGYLVEYSLSVDNIFVIVLIFSYFGIRGEYQHRVLFWGILGALLMRGAMIALGATLIQRVHWITYLFGAFLLITGLRMLRHDEASVDPDANPIVRLVRRLVPVCGDYHGQQFFIRDSDTAGRVRWMATPLFIVLVVIETMDLVFAVDSIPAVFAVTRKPFIVYTSNIAAILGLRSLYFLLAGAVTKFRYLRFGLATILAFVGVKMLVAGRYPIPTLVSLGVIIGILAATALASAIAARRDPHGPT